MTPSTTERRIRAGLPVIRFLQTRLPLRWTRQPLRRATARAQLPADVTRHVLASTALQEH